MKLSKRLRKWKGNLTTRTPAEYVLTLRADVNGFSDEVKALEVENKKLRKLMRDTYDCICEMYRYVDGGYAYEDAEADPAYGPILKRMRDLGIEADDAPDEPMSDAARKVFDRLMDKLDGDSDER